jgi:hypothetical protein
MWGDILRGNVNPNALSTLFLYAATGPGLSEIDNVHRVAPAHLRGNEQRIASASFQVDGLERVRDLG